MVFKWYNLKVVNRYQVVSSLMAFVAMFLVIFTFNYLKIDLDPSPAQQKSNISFALDEDWDNDGLQNREESFWNTDPNNSDTDGDGYLDGEEVASGHDPLTPGPNDKIIKENLTQRLSEIALSGLAEGSLKPSSSNYVESLNVVADNIVGQSQINLLPGQISVNEVPNSYDAIKTYEEKTAPLAVAAVEREAESILLLVDLIDDTEFFSESKLKLQEKPFQNLRNFAYERAADLSQTALKLETSPTPKILSEQHKFLIQTFKSLAISYSYLTNANSDPVQAMLAFQNIISLFTDKLPARLVEFQNSMQGLSNNL